MTNNNDEETLASEEDVNQTLVTSAQFNPCLRPCSTDCDSGETDCDIVTDNDEKEKMISMSEMKMEIEPKMKDNVHENKIVALQLESSEKDSLSSHLNNENEYKDEDTESSTQPSDNNRQSIRSLAYLLSPRMSVDMGSSAGSSNRTKSEDEEDEVENKVVDTSNSWAAKLFVKAFDNGRVRSATTLSEVGQLVYSSEVTLTLTPCCSLSHRRHCICYFHSFLSSSLFSHFPFCKCRFHI